MKGVCKLHRYRINHASNFQAPITQRPQNIEQAWYTGASDSDLLDRCIFKKVLIAMKYLDDPFLGRQRFIRYMRFNTINQPSEAQPTLALPAQ